MTTKKHEYLTKTWEQNDETYIFEVIIKKQTFLKKKLKRERIGSYMLSKHNGFKLEQVNMGSQLAWIASNNDYMIIKERTTGYKGK